MNLGAIRPVCLQNCEIIQLNVKNYAYDDGEHLFRGTLLELSATDWRCLGV